MDGKTSLAIQQKAFQQTHVCIPDSSKFKADLDVRWLEGITANPQAIGMDKAAQRMVAVFMVMYSLSIME
jgi:hypothetical protein